MVSTSEDMERFQRLSRYLSGQLNDAEAVRFEGDWARNPQWTAEIELDARLQSGLWELRKTGQLDVAMRGRWWVLPLRMLTMAAGIAALGFALWTWQFGRHAGATLLARAPTLALGDSVAIMRLRQAAQIAAIVELPARPRSIELRVMPDGGTDSAAQSYDLSLVEASADAAPAKYWLEHLTVGADAFIRVYLNSSRIAPGRYRLSIRQSGSTIGDEYLLDIRSAAASQNVN